MAFFGGAPFGSLLASVLAERIGAPNTVVLTGGACVLGALCFALERPRLADALLKVRN